MKLRRYISLALLSLFLLSIGGRATLVYMCHCDSMSKQHICCHNCVEHSDCDFHLSTYKSDCCAHHSDDIDVYTSTISSYEKRQHIAIIDLPFAVVPTSAHISACETNTEHIYVTNTHLEPSCTLSSKALRAPPVLA